LFDPFRLRSARKIDCSSESPTTSFITRILRYRTYQITQKLYPVGKIAEKAVCKECIFDNMALCFERRINKKRIPSDCFFGDFAHWDYSYVEWTVAGIEPNSFDYTLLFRLC